MINIQRNYFIENVLLETNIIDKKQLFNLPYSDYITTAIEDELVLIFFDLDRLNSLETIKKDLEIFRNKDNKVIFIPSSKVKKKLEVFVTQI